MGIEREELVASLAALQKQAHVLDGAIQIVTQQLQSLDERANQSTQEQPSESTR